MKLENDRRMNLNHSIRTVFTLVFALTLIAVQAQDRKKAMHMLEKPTTLDEVKAYALGEWASISVELRPTEDRTGAGNIQPTFLILCQH